MRPEELPTEWTPGERIRVATVLLGIIQSDVPAGRYGEVGRPNVTSVLHVLHESPEVLGANRDELARMVGDVTEGVEGVVSESAVPPGIVVGSRDLRRFRCGRGHEWENPADTCVSFGYYSSGQLRSVRSGPFCPHCVAEALRLNFGGVEVTGSAATDVRREVERLRAGLCEVAGMGSDPFSRQSVRAREILLGDTKEDVRVHYHLRDRRGVPALHSVCGESPTVRGHLMTHEWRHVDCLRCLDRQPST